MTQFTTFLIIVLFSEVLSAQNTNNTLPSNGHNIMNDASNTFFTLNQTTGIEKQLAELAGTCTVEMEYFESESFSAISKRAEVNQQNKINDLKEKMVVSENKQIISSCNLGLCDIETSNTGFWIFISAVVFAVSALIGKGN